MDQTPQDLAAAYYAQIPITVGKTRQLCIIGMIGKVGAGKSTVAQHIAARAGLFVASNDRIRRFLDTQGFEGESPRQDIVQFIAEGSAKFLCDRGVSHIIDADLLKFYDLARRQAVANQAHFYLLEITCPEPLILERLDRRVQSIGTASSADSHAGRADYAKRLQAHAETKPPQHYDFRFDTSQDLDPQVEAFCQLLRRDGVIS